MSKGQEDVFPRGAVPASEIKKYLLTKAEPIGLYER